MLASVNAIESGITWFLLVLSALMAIFALIDAAIRPAAAFVQEGKLSKPAWLLILTLALLICVAMRSPMGLLGLIGTVASGVYLADVRPALSARGGRR